MTCRAHLETSLAAAVRAPKWKLEVAIALVIGGFTATGVLLLRIMLLLPAD